MQPPPRKVKWTVALKNIHAEQFSKLQQKHQHDLDLLEDIRSFSKQRSVIEKEYAQALGKLVQQYLAKRQTSVGKNTPDNGDQNKTVGEVWRTLLEQSDRVVKARLNTAESYAQDISEPVKAIKTIKCQVAKKVFEQLIALQKEAAQTIAELSKSHKSYSDDEHIAHEIRLKANEAASKVQNKSTNIFTSFATLQKNSAKLSQRKESSEIRSTAARNEYLLNLAASNAHQRRYYSTDLPKFIETLDGDMYESMKGFYAVSAKAELQCCGITQECFSRLQMDAEKLDREHNMQNFLHNNKTITHQIQYEFEAQDGDQVRTVCRTYDGDQSLEKEARKWATRIAKENRALRDNLHQLELLESGGGGGKVVSKSSDETSPGGSTVTSPVDPETRMEELRQTLRRLETGKEKAEARIGVLQEAGVDVEEWLSITAAEPLSPQEDMKNQRSSSSVSLKTDTSEGRSRVESAVDDTDPSGTPLLPSSDPITLPSPDSTYINYEDEDFIDETFLASEESTFWAGRSQPTKCVSLYDFQATNADELSLQENELLELVGDGEGDGWVKARNAGGVVGYIPENYIQVTEDDDLDLHSPIAVAADDDDDVNEMYVDDPPLPGDSAGETGATISPGAQSNYSMTDYEVQQAVNSATLPPSDGIWVRAMYDYEATSAEELTFREGQLIEVVNKDENGVDDGFWEGRVNGRVGVFPCVVVEELDITDQIIIQELTSAPVGTSSVPSTVNLPTSDPPQLEITQPTPSPSNDDRHASLNKHNGPLRCRDRTHDYNNEYYATESTV